MKKIFGVVLLMQLLSSIVVSQKIVGCYYPSYKPIAQIDIKLCTHAYYAFIAFNKNGDISSGDTSRFLALKSQNPSVKLLVSIGGYNTETAAFSAIAANSTLTATFVKNVVTLAQSYDGIDIDWLYPEPTEQKAFVNLLASLKSALSAQGKILTVAVGAGSSRIFQSYDFSNVCKYVDLLNLMSYDLHWPYTVTGPNTGYSLVDKAVSLWINGGCPSNKVVLGFAAYGRKFDLTSSNNGVLAPASGASVISYRDICNKLKYYGWTTLTTDQTPYSYNGYEWISYDDPKSLVTKLNIVKNRNMPGVFFWSTEQDDYDNSCGSGKFPLITAVYNALNPGSTVTTLKCTTDGFFAYPGDCTKYYRCVTGTMYILSCAPGLGWNQAITACDWKYNIPGCI